MKVPMFARSRNDETRPAGTLLPDLASIVMKGLSVIGAASILVVGGSILACAFPLAHASMQEAARHVASGSVGGASLKTGEPLLSQAVLSVAVGAFAVVAAKVRTQRTRSRTAK